MLPWPSRTGEARLCRRSMNWASRPTRASTGSRSRSPHPGSGACSRSVTSSINAWAEAMLARCIGTRPDCVARVSFASRTARRSARATACRSATEVCRAACTASALPAGSGTPTGKCPVESSDPQPGRHACAHGSPGVTATSRVRRAGSRSTADANVLSFILSRCLSILDSCPRQGTLRRQVAPHAG